MSYGGSAPSTLSDVLRYVVALHVQIGPAHVSGATYAPGDTAAANGRVYTCFDGGTAAEAPSGPASYRDANGVGWYPMFYDGERFAGQEGAPPRIMFVQSEGGGALGPPLEIGGRQLGSWDETVTCRVWGRETTADDARTDTAKALVMRLIAAFNAAGVGRLGFKKCERIRDTSIVTFGEEYELQIAYEWAIPRDEAIDLAARALATDGTPHAYARAPEDPDRPNGIGSGDTYQIAVTMEDERP